MRIVYIFTSLGNAGPECRWDINCHSMNPSAQGLQTEGFFYMWNRLIEKKVISSCLTVIESARGAGSIKFNSKHTCVVMPHIDNLDGMLQEDDIIVPRGGFRPWPPFLTRMNEQKRWLLFYRAATHRLKWPQWDIVLDDLLDKPLRFGERLHFPFNKPIDPSLFPFRPGVKKDFDIIINASHIHDKKGQWKVINGIAAYRDRYRENLRVCLPGGWHGGIETRRIPSTIKKFDLDVYAPGMVSRQALSHLFSRSKLYVHLGVAGQNDRGVLEAMSSGLPVILANTQFHAPFTFKNPRCCMVTSHQHNPWELAEDIRGMLTYWDEGLPKQVSDFYEQENGVENVVLPRMTRLLQYCATHPVDREAVLREYGV